MTKKNLLTIYLLTIATIAFGQNQFKATVLDSLTSEPLIGATVVLKGTTNGATTDMKGDVTVSNIPNNEQTIVVSFIGYETLELSFQFPIYQPEPEKILLSPSESQLEEILIESTRANKSVANLPTRTEVLTEEIDEAASMEPSRIAHLITHSTGIQVQTTSASSNGAVVRIQGLNGRYTQILKDGFPLYGGFSGSLDVLQIPPLDLRQVEYVKGSASTLYGGGAIGGLINLLTKKATQDETLLHINFSHIGAKDFNVYELFSFHIVCFSCRNSISNLSSTIIITEIINMRFLISFSLMNWLIYLNMLSNNDAKAIKTIIEITIVKAGILVAAKEKKI